MGEAKRRKKASSRAGTWSSDIRLGGKIALHLLPPVPTITAARLSESGVSGTSPNAPLVLQTYRAVVGARSFMVGFCLGVGERLSAVGHLVVERLTMEVGDADTPLHIVPISDKEVAWDLVLRHLRTFTGDVLLFAFSDSLVYDAGTAEVYYSSEIALFQDGQPVPRLDTDTQRHIERESKASTGETPPVLHTLPGTDPLELPPVFEMRASNGKYVRLTVWNGRKNFIHEIPPYIIRLVGGDKIALIQVGHPVGIDGRSSVALTDSLAEFVDGVVHWARDSKTYQSIVRDLILADVSSALPPVLPADWSPEIILMPVKDKVDRT